MIVFCSSNKGERMNKKALAKRLLRVSCHRVPRKLWVSACCEGRVLWKADPWGSHHLRDGGRFNLDLSESICICEMAQQRASWAAFSSESFATTRGEVSSFQVSKAPWKVRVISQRRGAVLRRGRSYLTRDLVNWLFLSTRMKNPLSEPRKIAGRLIIISVRWSMSHTTMMIDYQKTHFIQFTFFV